VDGYSPIWTPDSWSEGGGEYKLGTKGLLAWLPSPPAPPVRGTEGILVFDILSSLLPGFGLNACHACFERGGRRDNVEIKQAALSHWEVFLIQCPPCQLTHHGSEINQVLL